MPGSPFHVLNDNPNNPGLVKLYGPGVTAGQVRAKKPVEFTVDCTQSGPGDLKIKIVSSKRKSVPVSVLGKCTFMENLNLEMDLFFGSVGNYVHYFCDHTEA